MKKIARKNIDRRSVFCVYSALMMRVLSYSAGDEEVAPDVRYAGASSLREGW